MYMCAQTQTLTHKSISLACKWIKQNVICIVMFEHWCVCIRVWLWVCINAWAFIVFRLSLFLGQSAHLFIELSGGLCPWESLVSLQRKPSGQKVLNLNPSASVMHCVGHMVDPSFARYFVRNGNLDWMSSFLKWVMMKNVQTHTVDVSPHTQKIHGQLELRKRRKIVSSCLGRIDRRNFHYTMVGIIETLFTLVWLESLTVRIQGSRFTTGK